MKKNKILKILIGAVVLLVVFAVVGKKAGWFGKAVTVKVAVENAEKRRITEAITSNGKIQPEKEVKITPDVSGEIVELTVKEGDHAAAQDQTRYLHFTEGSFNGCHKLNPCASCTG
jgi:HlyD family secretion protein